MNIERQRERNMRTARDKGRDTVRPPEKKHKRHAVRFRQRQRGMN